MTAAASPPRSPLAAQIVAASDAIRARFPRRPDAAVILGTGLGRLAEEIDVEAAIPYAEIPGFPEPTVEAHRGRLLCGTLAGKTVLAMQGRFHRYEGHTLQQVTLPVRVLRAVGAPVLIVSNACGGMNPAWRAGDLMLIRDHINLIGDNPLIGPNDDALGPRFPDMSAPYDAALAGLARETAAAEGLTLREGVYVAVAGPNLETRAEYRMLRGLGADVVGMSTVPEVIVAVHAGMRVLGLSIITDECVPETLQPTSLAAVIAVAQRAEPALGRVVHGILERM
ncbi:MAG: purine-nucleoside phosphorylase [Gemmatimonadota bacterium]|nr:purine-nucleoside phosphorylase [Gemmatimonadota bacterium]MDE3127519.1 purine-nucleoside phosphorylase [Gemmatimonadota bacterium]MDE3173638.1 purine-nucleoside phosphorylase [Gemmatimonadota bacterium]MDE3215989.1 purine-nucleoside phosphorylase [Gemmatimonadota bacterium]